MILIIYKTIVNKTFLYYKSKFKQKLVNVKTKRLPIIKDEVI